MTTATYTAPPDVTITDDTVIGRHGAIPIRRYEPSTPAHPDPIVWIHGGAFSGGGLDQLESHAVAAELAGAGHRVIAVDYRRVPEWSWLRPPKPGVLPGVRYPIPLDDICDTVEAISTEHGGRPVVLGGASAGACLSAAATARLRSAGHPGPAALVLAYGTFHAALPPLSPELRQRIRGRYGFAQFRPGTVEKMNRNYAGSLAAMADPFAFPGGHPLPRFPATLVLDADRDSLRASGESFAAELAAAGAPVDHVVVSDTTHGFFDRPTTAGFTRGLGIVTDWLQRTIAHRS